MSKNTGNRPAVRWVEHVIVSVLLLITGLFLLQIRHWGKFIEVPVPLIIAGHVTGLFSIYGGFAALKRLLRIIAPTAKEAMSRDLRPPILYLRSFTIDSRTIPIVRIKTGIAEAIPDPRLEELLVGVFQSIGPVIAVGKPGEPLPELGAARLYTAETDWQQEVLGLLDCAQLVVIATGSSSGLLWEISNAVKMLDPTKIIFVFTEYDERNPRRRESAYYNFINVAGPIIPTELPKNIGDAILIRFTETWESILVCPPKQTPRNDRLRLAIVIVLKLISKSFRNELERDSKLTHMQQYRKMISSVPRQRYKILFTIYAALAIGAGLVTWVITALFYPEAPITLPVLVMLGFIVIVVATWSFVLWLGRRRIYGSCDD